MSTKCTICHIELSDQNNDEMNFNCGGDCILCMADAGDPECIERVLKTARQWRDIAFERLLKHSPK